MQATATVGANDPLTSRYPGAQLIVRAKVDKVFVNCARLMHRYRRVSASPYVPDAKGQTPYPSWKRIDQMQDALPPKDMGRAASEGGVITEEEYRARLARGES